MDEPLSNLDAKLRVQLRTEIKRLHQETKTTTIYVTHDQEEAMTLGDKIVVMSKGQVQQIGTPQEVFFKPTNIFVAGFVGSPSMNLLDGTLRREAELMVELPGFTQPVPERLVARLRVNGRETVKWGIRPEHIELTDGAGANDVPGQLEVIEPLGSRQLLFVRAGTEVFTVLEDATIPHSVGDNCYLCFDDKQVHMFETETRLSLAD
jgi:multiple sugar transport system ATP-binding protein